MIVRKIGLFVGTLLLLSGCSGKQLVTENQQKSALITFKTPNLRYADQGFIYQGNNFVKVEIYSMGQPLLNLDINALNICMSLFECMEKADFNARVLHPAYPPTLLENIFTSQPIFNGKNLIENRNGFTQTIEKEGEYNIDYSVVSEATVFRDTINKILIKVKPQ
ncbi:MAG TPA: hypothetical protein ENK86_05060 [Campylobacterales bacterium]|nr:hypothetical protein [Campylobacterales bacterium]